MSRLPWALNWRIVRLMLAIGCVALADGAASAPSQDQPEFQQEGRVIPKGGGIVAGGEFLLERETPGSSGASEGGWNLTRSEPENASCLCGDEIFSDGFESGSTSAWSSTSP